MQVVGSSAEQVSSMSPSEVDSEANHGEKAKVSESVNDRYSKATPGGSEKRKGGGGGDGGEGDLQTAEDWALSP